MDDTKCEICQARNQVSAATVYCPTCPHLLCDSCAFTHRHLNATKDHKTREISESVPEQKKLCGPCQCLEEVSDAVKYCSHPDCEEYLCQTCSKNHQSCKATRTHELVPVPSSGVKRSNPLKNEENLMSLNGNGISRAFKDTEQSRRLSKRGAAMCHSCKQQLNEDNVAEYHCSVCEEFLCFRCRNQHEEIYTDHIINVLHVTDDTEDCQQPNSVPSGTLSEVNPYNEWVVCPAKGEKASLIHSREMGTEKCGPGARASTPKTTCNGNRIRSQANGEDETLVEDFTFVDKPFELEEDDASIRAQVSPNSERFSGAFKTNGIAGVRRAVQSKLNQLKKVKNH